MARLSILLVSCLTLLTGIATAANDKPAALDLTPQNFDKTVLKSSKPALVEFFAPWCGHCKNLAPVYEELGQAFAFASDKVTVGKVDADEHRDLGRRFGIQGFPTLKWFDGKSDQPEDYKGGRDFESLAGWITDKTGVRPRVPKKEPSKVEMLNDASFKEVVGSDKNVLVAFTAPWCGHCKSLAPTWETLANDYVLEPSVVIAKVDAEAENAKALTREQGISGFPTIKFFPKGSNNAEPYQGARSEQAFVDFLNTKAGTYRAVGGGLNEKAGTIAHLDSLVGKHVAARNFTDLVGDVKKGVKGAQDKSSQYYVKVAEKISQNQEYAGKEFARLTKIIQKGGSAPEKLDDLVSRSNILRQFLGGGKEDEKRDEL